MAWNGRNESILGSKPVSEAPPAPSKKESEENVKADKAVDTKKKTASAAPAPPKKSVWNGRHTKIMEIRDKSKEAAASAAGEASSVASVPTTARSPSPASVSIASTSNDSSSTKRSKKEQQRQVVVTSSSSSAPNKDKNHDIKTTLEPLAHAAAPGAKEDETTNSTAGSSTTNTTIADMNEDSASGASASADAPSLEVKEVVTTTAVVSTPSNSDNKKGSDKKKDGNGNKGIASAEGKSGQSSAAANAGRGNNGSNNQGSGRPNNQGKASGAHNANGNGNARRPGSAGNTNKQGRGNTSNNNNAGNNIHAGNNSNNNGRHNNGYSRGNSGAGGSGRRRGANNSSSNSNNNVDNRPVCTFFLQGRCNRGSACAFTHDRSQAPPTLPSIASPSPSSPLRRSGTHPGAGKGKISPPKKAVGAPTAGYMPNKRVFDPNKARAIQLAKDAQDFEDRSNFASPKAAKPDVKIIPDEKKDEEVVEKEPPFFSIDVECIATGYGSCARGINDCCGNEGRTRNGAPSSQYNDRSHRYPGRIAMVDSEGNLVVDIIIRPPQDGKGVISYLTPLTGLTEEICLGPDAKTLEEAVDTIKELLPKDGVLVGQAIDHDVEWLGLVVGRDFGRVVDISEIFRQRMPAVLNVAAEAVKKMEEEGQQKSQSSNDPSSDEHLGFATRYRHFSLRHVCLNLLGTDIQSGVHDPILDARYSLTLFHKYRNSSVTQLRIVRDGLHRAPITPGFAAENTPVIDGVCVSAAGYPYKRAARVIWRWYAKRRDGEKLQQRVEEKSS